MAFRNVLTRTILQGASRIKTTEILKDARLQIVSAYGPAPAK
jgi:hypothetical protein